MAAKNSLYGKTGVVQWNINKKSYVAYQMAPLPMPLDDLEGHLCCLKSF